jgi:S1-C subfamily serine protease
MGGNMEYQRVTFHRMLLVASVLTVFFRPPAAAQTESIDFKGLAKKASPAVMLLVVSDASGKEIATGTGFVVSADGQLMTSYRVIAGGKTAIAKGENGAVFPVKGVLVADPKNDLAELKIEGKGFPFLPFSAGHKIQVGARIAIIGSPLGSQIPMPEGTVSAVPEGLMGGVQLLQVTAAIPAGAGGSPVLDAKGDVIGVASASLPGGQALNFAVPADAAAAFKRAKKLKLELFKK